MSTQHDIKATEYIGIHYVVGHLRSIADWFGRNGAYFILPLVIITMWDVFTRKAVVVQIFLVQNVTRYFESTMLQELEWHSHTALFALVLGYGFTHNRHVRVDMVRMHLKTIPQAWIEFLGTTLFMIPYTLVVIYFCYMFAWDAFISNEISASLVGLSHRWIIKTVLGVGLIVALLSGIAVWLQTVLVLFGSSSERFELMTLEWPEEMGSGVEGYKRLELDDGETETIQELLGINTTVGNIDVPLIQKWWFQCVLMLFVTPIGVAVMLTNPTYQNYAGTAARLPISSKIFLIPVAAVFWLCGLAALSLTLGWVKL